MALLMQLAGAGVNPVGIGAHMTSCFANLKHKQTWLRPACLAIVSLAAVFASADQVHAATARKETSVASVESRAAGEPIMAIVSLRDQRITVYDKNGWVLRAPVSSGQWGRETPAGIFSVIQKDAEHYSNLYDDAYMPHMQRLTWSGIALHGGPLPGHPASHGCVRMPYDFAEHLFSATSLGMRVIVAPGDVAPVEVSHPALFSPKSDADAVAVALAAEADEAGIKADQARLAAATATREAARAMMPVRVAENLKHRAEAQLAAAERAVASAGSTEAKQQAEETKAKAGATVAELQTQLAAAKAELQPKLDAVAPAREAAVAAETARVAAAEAARKGAHDLAPVSVFISRKTQRLYVRQAFQPILESPVTIRDSDRPIGTHVFTAIERTGGEDMRWSVVSLKGGQGVVPRGLGGPDTKLVSTDTGDAKAALDRITIPQDALNRIEASPGSSLIISDEALSSETGKGTEFVVIMSDEPQGGIKMRRRSPETEFRYVGSRNRLPYWRSPFAGPYSTW
jgi:hypothetical protein